MSDRFDVCLPITLRYEGGFVDDPVDPGGRTNHGITQTTYDAWRKTNSQSPMDVRYITDAEVAAIYRRDYWLLGGCDRLAPPIDLCHFDACVNHGPGRAKKFLIAAGGTAKGYLIVREQFYHGLVERKPELQKFLKGWLNRVNDLRKEAGVT